MGEVDAVDAGQVGDPALHDGEPWPLLPRPCAPLVAEDPGDRAQGCALPLQAESALGG